MPPVFYSHFKDYCSSTYFSICNKTVNINIFLSFFRDLTFRMCLETQDNKYIVSEIIYQWIPVRTGSVKTFPTGGEA